METRAEGLGIEIITADLSGDPLPVIEKYASRLFGIMVQYPGADGLLCDYTELCKEAHQRELLVTAACDLLALAVLKEPAAWGADIAVGSAQRFGLPPGFGGPITGYIACSEKYRRNIPGRIVGLSVDRLGKPAYRLALQTREQHIKREKATSNICTATALMATMAGMYAVYHGRRGSVKLLRTAGIMPTWLPVFWRQRIYPETPNFFDTIELTGVDTARIKANAQT
jgi:glycine dehydrogenase